MILSSMFLPCNHVTLSLCNLLLKHVRPDCQDQTIVDFSYNKEMLTIVNLANTFAMHLISVTKAFTEDRGDL